MDAINMTPAGGARCVRHVGDQFLCSIQAGPEVRPDQGWRARLRTNIGRGAARRAEILEAATSRIAPFGACWHDIPLEWAHDRWTASIVLPEVGFYVGKPYLIDPDGFQRWPDGPDFGVSVHPEWTRSANTLYCAFTRLLGATRLSKSLHPETHHRQLAELRSQGTAVLPASGTFRDLARQLPHIIDRLGCRIIQLLPVHPTPTVFARFGPLGSPYAALDLTAVDPALVEFDQRTTGIQQFCELTRAIHARGARVFLDIVINHTGWGSRLFEEHPEFFRREPDGRFASPGAWGTVWEDLVELDQNHTALWKLIADSLITWCRRGVDGFRCDAGYKIPVHVWQYITARIHHEFPDVVFLLEGLGGSWDATEQLLTHGGMQWAYSELFQNETPSEIQGYLDYALEQSRRVGTYVHFSETHDNHRLAARGIAWSRLRNRLCALTSVAGGYGFTSGVEWLAPEKIRVHERTGLAWDQPDNLVDEIAQLNRVLTHHACFAQPTQLRRLSPPASQVFALLRTATDPTLRALVLINTSLDCEGRLELARGDLGDPGDWRHDLLDPSLPRWEWTHQACHVHLGPGEARCIATCGLPPDGRKAAVVSERRSWFVQAAAKVLPAEILDVSAEDAPCLADAVARYPEAVLAACSHHARSIHPGSVIRIDLAKVARLALDQKAFPNVIIWTRAESRRVLSIPPGWWLLVRDPAPFRVHLSMTGPHMDRHSQAICVDQGWVAAFPPIQVLQSTDGTLEFEEFSNPAAEPLSGTLRFLTGAPAASPDPDPDGVILLTNGRGGMARLPIDFGTVHSKYDAALAANLHPSLPVDRHVLVKRVRAWLNADGFISALDRHNLARLEPGQQVRWEFRVNAGNGRTASISASVMMLPRRNTTVFQFSRAQSDAPLDARLVVRVDLEDRSFHAETQRNPGSERHFQSHTRILSNETPGFVFEPETDRKVQVHATRGRYHDQAEWTERIEHRVEASRGQVACGDAYSPGWFDIPLAPGETADLVLDAEPTPVTTTLAPTQVDETVPNQSSDPIWGAFENRLRNACRQFLVQRDQGSTIIAGYPWFLDWGRDTFIAARGFLAAGWHQEVIGILDVFAPFAEHGTLPNSIHGANASNRDTSDAPLWFGVLIEETAARMGPELLSRIPNGSRCSLLDSVRNLAMGYLEGTPNGIRVDPVTALVWSPSHFTWMDTNYPASTPRQGYPVEIQALWIRVLEFLAREKAEGAPWQRLAQQARAAIDGFYWMEDQGWYSDVLLAQRGEAASSGIRDQALRPNALFLVTLGIVTGARAQRQVSATMRHLHVPGALRSLAALPVSPPLAVHAPDGRLLNDPDHPYWGRYEGDEDTRRKPAYHNGTAWCWVQPSLAEAWLRAWPDDSFARQTALAIIAESSRLLDHGCLGHLPEIVDGDAPHEARGCDAQAWSVTESLRVLRSLLDTPAAPA